MSNPTKSLTYDELDRLTRAEKEALVEELWDSTDEYDIDMLKIVMAELGIE